VTVTSRDLFLFAYVPKEPIKQQYYFRSAPTERLELTNDYLMALLADLGRAKKKNLLVNNNIFKHCMFPLKQSQFFNSGYL
jgi:hypothetical protein